MREQTEKRIAITVVAIIVTGGCLIAHHLYLQKQRLEVEKAKVEEQQKAESKMEKLRTVIHKLTKP